MLFFHFQKKKYNQYINCHKSVFLNIITRQKCYNENDNQNQKVATYTNYSQCYPYSFVFDVFCSRVEPNRKTTFEKLSQIFSDYY